VTRPASPKDPKPRGKPRSPRTMPGRNGGTLLVGPSNKGGPGRPPSALRELARESFAERLWVLEQIADGEPIVKVLRGKKQEEVLISASPADRIKAVSELGRFGLGAAAEVDVTSGGERLQPKTILKMFGQNIEL